MGAAVKSIAEKESPHYKKSFLASLIVILLISSLAIHVFAGQAMGQSENDNEPLSIARIAGSAIATIFFMISIITLFIIIVRYKTAKINPNEIEPILGRYRLAFLYIVTLFLYRIYFYAEYVTKLNIMCRAASENAEPEIRTKLAPINFRTRFWIVCWAISISPIIFMFTHVFLLNPAAYTAIFNLDSAALNSAIGARLFFGFDTAYIEAVGLLYALVVVFAIASVSFIVFIGAFQASAFFKELNVKTRLQALLRHYYEVSRNYSSDCFAMLNKYKPNTLFMSIDTAESQNHEAFGIVVACHNE